MGNRWTAEYDSDELSELEREAQALDRRGDELAERIQELEARLARVNEESARVDNEGRQAAAETRAEAEGISIMAALTANERSLREADEAFRQDAATRRAESGYAQ